MSLQKITDKLITLIAVGMCVFQLYTAFYMPFPGMQQRSIHLACGLALAFLVYPKKRPENPSLRNMSYLFGIALAVLTFITCLNVTFNWLEMNEPMRLIQPTQSDKVLGFLIKTLIISKKPGNTGKSRDKDTEFTTHLLHSEGALTRCPFP